MWQEPDQLIKLVMRNTQIKKFDRGVVCPWQDHIKIGWTDLVQMREPDTGGIVSFQ
jgi:hypothetical protein